MKISKWRLGLFLFIVCLTSTTTSMFNNVSAEDFDYLPYKNTDMGFSIEYPSNWSVADGASGVVNFDSPYGGESDPFTELLNVSLFYAFEPTTLQEFVDQTIMEYDLIGYTLIDSTAINLSDNPAQKLTIQAIMLEKEVRLIQIISVKDDLIYVITYGSTPEDLPEYAPIFNHMVDSFLILESSENTGKEIQELLQEANQLYFDYEYTKALEKTEIILILDPNNYNALSLKSLILFDMSNYSEAEKTADRIIDLTGFDAIALFVKGMSLYGQGQSEEALEYIDFYLALGEEDPLPLSVKAIILAENGELEESKKILDTVLQRNPDFPFALYAQGTYFFILKDYNQALVFFDKALELEPLNPDFLNDKGTVLMEQGKTSEAESVFDEILKNYPSHSYALNNKGVILLERGENSEALKYFTEASEIEPDNLLFLRNKIAALSNSGIIDLAQIAYDQLLQLDPNYDEPFEEITTASISIDDDKTESTSESTQIPDWIRNNAKWWAEGGIGDTDFVSGIQFLIKEGIIQIPETTQSGEGDSSQEIPAWIKNNADWWSQGLISDDDFIKGIQYLVEQGIIKV